MGSYWCITWTPNRSCLLPFIVDIQLLPPSSPNSKPLCPTQAAEERHTPLWTDRTATAFHGAQGEMCSEILGRGEGFRIGMELGRRKGSCQCPKSHSTPTGRQKQAHHNCRGGSLLLTRMARRALAQRFPMVLKPIHHFTNFMPDQDGPTTPNCPAGTTSPLHLPRSWPAFIFPQQINYR